MVAEAVKEERVVCGKCGGLNDAAARHCVHCEAHLYVACGKCGAVNPRAARRCDGCGTRLHRTAWSRMRRRALKRVKVWEIVLVLVVSVLFVFLLLKLNTRSTSSLPSGSEPGAESPSFR